LADGVPGLVSWDLLGEHEDVGCGAADELDEVGRTSDTGGMQGRTLLHLKSLSGPLVPTTSEFALLISAVVLPFCPLIVNRLEKLITNMLAFTFRFEAIPMKLS
jgi:hypothetical protein